MVGFPGSDEVTNHELLELDCDILVPAALENQITAHNAPTDQGEGRGRGRQRADHARGR